MNGYEIITLGKGNWDYFVFANAMFPVKDVLAITALGNNNYHVYIFNPNTNSTATNLFVVTGLAVK